MGASGENNDYWYQEAVQLLESNNIGWAWWTWKKMKSTSGSYSIKTPAGYQDLLNYWSSGGTKPDATTAANVMMQLANNAKLENCVRNDGAIKALTGHARSCDGATFVSIASSGATRIQAEDYCSMLGVSTEVTLDEGGGMDVGWLDVGNWIAYNINVPKQGSYKVEYRVASKDGTGGLQMQTKTGTALGKINTPLTGDWQKWTTISHTVVLSAGQQNVVIASTAPGWNFNWFALTLS